MAGGPPRRGVGFGWAGAAFAAVAAAIYCIAAVEGLFHPINLGSERIWALVILAAAAIAIPRWPPGFPRLLLAFETVCALLIAILSGRIVALLTTIVLLAACHAVGAAVLRASRFEVEDDLERSVLALSTGFCLFALLFLTLAAARLLYSGVLWAAVGAVVLLCRKTLREEIERFHLWILRPLPDAPPALATRAAFAVGGLGLLLTLTWVVAPEVQFDALNYHLVVPRDELAVHAIVRPIASEMFMARLAESMYGVGMGLAGAGMPNFLALSVAAVAIAGVLALGRRLAGKEAAVWSAILFGTIPMVTSLASTGLNDLWVAMLLGASVLALLRIRESRTVAPFLFCAALAGAAAGAKLNALFAAPAIAAAAILELAARRRGSIAPVLAGGALAAAVGLLPWCATSFAYGGSLIFPLPAPGHGLGKPAGVYLLFGVGRSLRAAATILQAMTFHSGRFGEALPRGGLGLTVLLAPLVVVALAVGTRRVRIVAAIALSVFVLWWATLQYGRYLVPDFALALPAIAAVLPWSRGGARRLVRPALFAGAVAQLLVLPLVHWKIPSRFPVTLAAGMESRRAFLERAVPEYRAIEWLNAANRDGERVASDVAGIRYYCRAPMGAIVDTEKLGGLFQGSDDATDRTLLEGGYRWFFSSKRVASARENDYLARYADLEFESSGFRVFRLSGLSEPPAARKRGELPTIVYYRGAGPETGPAS